MSAAPCSQYAGCDVGRPHFHFKVRDGERIMFITANENATPDRAGADTPTGRPA